MKNIRRTTKIFVFEIFCLLNIEAMQEPFVMIGQAGYQTLHDAVNNAISGDTLTILKNMEITQEISVKGKNITIQPEGDIVLRRGYDYDGHLFNIHDDASLTLKTNLKDENNRLVIDGDWKSNFIIDKNGKQVHLDENAPMIPKDKYEWYHDYEQNRKVEIKETGQHYVVADDGRRLYIDGTKRKLIIERSLANWIEGKVFIDEDLRLFVIGYNLQKIPLDIDNKVRYYSDNTGKKIVVDKFVERQGDYAAIVNEGHLIFNGNIIICNNCNTTSPEIIFSTFDLFCDHHTHYGIIYNHGTCDMLTGYIGWNKGNGVFNADGAVFNMYDGSIYKNYASHGAGILNYGKFYIHGGHISSNRTHYNGGGVYNGGVIQMISGSVSANEADCAYRHVFFFFVGNGGGIYNNCSGKLTIINGIIKENYANSGGGIYNENLFTMEGGSITKNSALGLYYFVIPESLKVIWGKIPGAKCGNGGGVLNNSNTAFTFTGTIINNTAKTAMDIFDKRRKDNNFQK